MPVSVKKLHFASSVEELHEKADLKAKGLSDKGTSMLCKSALKLLKEAERHFKINDEELAYVYYFKFVDLVVTLRSRSDFSKDPLSQTLLQAATEAINKATSLKVSLLNRYAALKEAELKRKPSDESSPSDLVENRSKSNKENEVADKVGEVSKGTDVPVENTALERSISPSALLSLILDRTSSFVIFDTRPAKGFEESHIRHSNCVNIPSEIIIPGITAKQLERELSGISLEKWLKRNTVDHVILIDWDTTDTCLSRAHPLHTLEEAMCKWDLQTPLTKPPLILIGGYKEWVLKYPMYSTKALDILSMEAPRDLFFITDVSEIDFPDFDESDNRNEAIVEDKNKKNAGLKNTTINGWMSKPFVNRQNKPKELLNTELNTTFKVTNKPETTVDKSPVPFFLTDKPEADVDKSPVKFFQPAKESVKSIPEVNRSLKPVYVPDKGTIIQDAAASKPTVSDTETNELARLRRRKELEAEKELANSLKVMELKNEEEDAQSLSQEDEQAAKQLLEMKNAEKKQKEKELKKNIDLERLREQKKLITEDSKPSNTDIIKSSNEMKDIPKTKDLNTNEYTTPLKRNDSADDSSSCGLIRSYSSPNIAQLVAESMVDNRKKLPTVDRSLKPKIDSMFTSVKGDSQLKIPNLNPTFGNCPARPVTGLRNLGNTCFMNSVIQCLSNTDQLANYFTTQLYRKHFRRSSKTKGEIAEEFGAIIRALWMGSFKCIAPKDFKNTLSKYVPMYSGSEQQDSHEFLVVLMDKLHGDLNQGQDGEPPPDLDSFSENVATEKFWEYHRFKNRSKITDIFEGLLRSTLSCLSCGKTSNSFEAFSSLSLPISSNKCSLEDCLKSFLKPEKMCGEGAWYCPSCKQKKEASKTLTFCRLPNVLILQLKRFSYDGTWRRKLQSFVEFQPVLDVLPERTYKLYGIVNHYGYLEGGHYTACCKNGATGKWYKYDDHEVSEISLSDCQTSAAYLLFYMAIDN